MLDWYRRSRVLVTAYGLLGEGAQSQPPYLALEDYTAVCVACADEIEELQQLARPVRDQLVAYAIAGADREPIGEGYPAQTCDGLACDSQDSGRSQMAWDTTRDLYQGIIAKLGAAPEWLPAPGPRPAVELGVDAFSASVASWWPSMNAILRHAAAGWQAAHVPEPEPDPEPDPEPQPDPNPEPDPEPAGVGGALGPLLIGAGLLWLFTKK